MISVIKKVHLLLDRDERLQALGILFLTIVMAFLELVGIASVLPFIAVISAPERIHQNSWLKAVYDMLHFDNDRDFLLFLGIVVLSFLVISNIAKALTRLAILRFSQMRSYTLSVKLLQQYLYQPYSFFLNRNTSQLRKNLGEIQSLVTNIIIPVMDVIARSCVIIAILFLLIFADPLLALGSGAVLGGAYVIVYLSLRRWLFTLGQRRLEALGYKSKITSEAFLGIKNVKLRGNESFYLDLYKTPSLTTAKASALGSVASELPRYALEIIAFGGILFIVLYELFKSQDIRHALPMITLYALAGYRLMPNFQSAFSSITKIRFNTALLDHASEELEHTATQACTKPSENIRQLAFNDKIELKDISFSYPGAPSPVLSDINLEIKKNSSLGIVGKTGSGKTTLVDILLGLLVPTKGAILIDGIAVTDDTRQSWQSNTAYVSQHIFLIDDTIRNNIAFGMAGSEIDDEQVAKAAKMAALDEFISSLPDGYDTVIGENGVRLSGGQRQRIGLARALYLDKPILVLDEATSALDNETEREVMDAINGLSQRKTIIMIAHRLQSLSRADHILDLEKHKLI